MLGNLYIVVDYASSQDGVSLRYGNLYLTIKVPFDTVLSEKEITINIFDSKMIKLKLDMNRKSGYQYKIEDGGLEKGKNAFVKVFLDSPRNNIKKTHKDKLVKLMGEIYGDPATTFQPEPIASIDT